MRSRARAFTNRPAARWIVALALAPAVASLVVTASRDAHASAVLRLDPAQLVAGADVVIDGEVVSVTSAWRADRRGIDTRVVVRVARVHKGAALLARDRAAAPRAPISAGVPAAADIVVPGGATVDIVVPGGTTVDIVVPGGTIDGYRQVIVGMPAFTPGDRARLHLRARGDGAYRVYGWSQGVWPPLHDGDRDANRDGDHDGDRDTGELAYRPPAAPGTAPDVRDPDMVYFSHNGLVWPPEQIPVAYRIGSAGSDDVAFLDVEAAVHAAFATWQDVPCSSLAFRYDGTTDLGVEVDDTNAVLFIEDGWVYGEEAAGATALFFLPGEPPTADIALNGQHFSWAVGVPGVAPQTQDIQAVLTHEIGHFSGLSHTMSSLDTMYFSWTPWQGQRSLSADDKLGLCALYPQMGDECDPAGPAGECAAGATCERYAMGTLCTPQPDPLGAFCNYDRVECESFCLFQSADLSRGYCSQFCDPGDPDSCPIDFACRPASAGVDPVMVCFEEVFPEPPLGIGCSVADDCPAGQFCGADGLCDYDCIEDFDCDDAGLVCSDRGQCVAAPAPGGCAITPAPRNEPGPAPLAPLSLLALLAWLTLRPRRGPAGESDRR